jgi:hypothetical protein
VDNLYQNLHPAMVGISLILVVLGVVAFFVLRRARIRRGEAKARAVDIDPNDEVVVVLAAASAVMLKRQVSVRRVRFLVPAAEPVWAVMGRLNIMASHAISRRKSQS